MTEMKMRRIREEDKIDKNLRLLFVTLNYCQCVQSKFCATNPWEIIMIFVTTSACVLTMEHQQKLSVIGICQKDCPLSDARESEYSKADVIIMTFIRCMAVLYSYYRFCNLYKMGSKYILGIAGLLPLLCSFILTTIFAHFLHIQVSGFKDTLFFTLLLMDIFKTGKLAQFALSGLKSEVPVNIGKGMSFLGPFLTLDTIVKTLVIGVGTLSGMHRLEVLCYLVCLSIIVNYLIFILFYPACLSLILELSDYDTIRGNYMLTSTSIEDGKKLHPIVYRIKLIMSVGLILVHIYSRNFDETNWRFGLKYTLDQSQNVSPLRFIWRWILLSSDHIVILVFLLGLLAKCLLFKDDVLLYTPSLQKLKPTRTRSEKAVQTSEEEVKLATRNVTTCLEIYRDNLSAAQLNDEEVLLLVKHKHISVHQIEKAIGDPERAVKIRRSFLESTTNLKEALKNLPYKGYGYSTVFGACCENVIGYTSLPVGLVGPLLLDGRLVYVPLATTQAGLVSKTNRSCQALLNCGITSKVVADGMTRGPVVRFSSVSEASEAMDWIKSHENFSIIKDSFDQTSRFGRLTDISVRIAGRLLFIRFVAKTGDAMGMNMLSKGTEMSLKTMQTYLPNMEILSLSGNFCTDKKSSALNWIQGRGKSIVCEAIIPAKIVHNVFKSTTHSLVNVHFPNHIIGAAMVGSIGGFNANASNLVSGVFIATGQDPAQNVCSSNCMTLMEPWGENGEDLYISCTMPSIEVGTVGGGTILAGQSACLDILGVRSSNLLNPGENATQLARIICGIVLAGELATYIDVVESLDNT